MKDQRQTYQEAIDRAERDFRAPDGKEMHEVCPYAFSSNFADVYYITAWTLYHEGKRPLFIHKSTGHRWTIETHGRGLLIVTVDRPDHRDGITEHTAKAQSPSRLHPESPDHWTRYYELRKRLEAGEARTDPTLWQQVQDALQKAEAHGEQVAANWNALGLTNG